MKSDSTHELSYEYKHLYLCIVTFQFLYEVSLKCLKSCQFVLYVY